MYKNRVAITNIANSSDLIDRKAVAELLNVSLTQVERLFRQGHLSRIVIPRRNIRYSRQECLELIKKWTISANFRKD